MTADHRWLHLVVSGLSVLLVGGLTVVLARHPLWHPPAGHASGWLQAAVGGLALAIAAAIGVVTGQRRRRGSPWRSAVPDGYGLAFVGVGLIVAAWVLGDGVPWVPDGPLGIGHPSPLGAWIGTGLVVTAPLRGIGPETGRRLRRGVVLASGSLGLAVLSVLLAPLNPLVDPLIVVDSTDARVVGPLGLVAQPVVLLLGATAILHRVELPRGALAVLFLGPAALGVAAGGIAELAIAPVAAGLAGDAVRSSGPPPSWARRSRRVFAAVLPLTYVVTYLALSAGLTGIAWPGQIWLGAILAAGFVGLCVGELAVSYARDSSNPHFRHTSR